MYNSNNNLDGLLLRHVAWSVKTAGPSPDNNNRTEIFLLGCKKAMEGNPCKGCFNSSTWDSTKAEFSHDPVEMAKHIHKNAPNRYITIGGGEPLDQIENLIILCRELKKLGFHIIVYTWRSLSKIYKIKDDKFKENILTLLCFIDIIIDGEFILEEKMWNGNEEDGFISSVGSGNQVIWNIKKRYGFAMKDIKSIKLNDNGEPIYEFNTDKKKTYELKII